MSEGLTADEVLALRETLACGEIHRVILNYARGVDQRNYELVRDCFHDDARIDYSVFAGSPDELVLWLERSQPNADRVSHLLGAPHIEFAPDGQRAEVETSCIQTAVLPRDEQGRVFRALSGLRFLDRFERRGVAWRIADRRNVPDWSARV